MSKKTYCDICGREIDDNSNYYISVALRDKLSINATVHYNRDVADVCSQCHDEFYKALKTAYAALTDHTQVCVLAPPDDPETAEQLKKSLESLDETPLVPASEANTEANDEPVEYTLKEVIDKTGCRKSIAYSWIYRRRDQYQLKTDGRGREQQSTIRLTNAQYDELVQAIRTLEAKRVLKMTEVEQPKRKCKQVKAIGNWDIEGAANLETKNSWLKEHIGKQIQFLSKGEVHKGKLADVGSFTFHASLSPCAYVSVITANTPLKLVSD